MSHRLLWVLVAAVPLWLLGTAAGYFFLVHVLSFPEWAAGICAAVGAIASGMGLAYGAVQAQRGLRGSHGATEEAGFAVPAAGPVLLISGLVASVVGIFLIRAEAGVPGGIVASLGATAVVGGALIVLRALRRFDEPAPPC